MLADIWEEKKKDRKRSNASAYPYINFCPDEDKESWLEHLPKHTVVDSHLSVLWKEISK